MIRKYQIGGYVPPANVYNTFAGRRVLSEDSDGGRSALDLGSRTLAKGFNWLMGHVGNAFNGLIATMAVPTGSATGATVYSNSPMYRYNLTRVQPEAKKAVERVGPYISPSNYVAAITQGSLNPHVGARVLASDPRLLSLGIIGDLLAFKNAPKIFKSTPKPTVVRPVETTLRRPKVLESKELHNTEGHEAVVQRVNNAVDEGTEYINRQVIPLAVREGNWRGFNELTNDFNVIADVEDGTVAGAWGGGNIRINDNTSASAPSTYVHEARHMFDTDIHTGTTVRENPVLRFLRSSPTEGVKPRESPIMLTKALENLIHEAYPTNWFDRFKIPDARNLTEKLSTNAENRKIFDRLYQEQYGKKPSVEELDLYILGMDDETFMGHLIRNQANGYQGVYFDNMLTQYGMRDAQGFTPMRNTNFSRAWNWNRANYRKVDRSRAPIIKKAIVGVPILSGFIYNMNNDLQ